MNFVGLGLADLTTKTFSHLRDSEQHARPALTVDLWCDEEQVVLPEGDEPERTWGQVADGQFASYNDGMFLELKRPGSITWLDREGGRIIGWRASETSISIEELSKPMPLILWSWYFDQGVHIIHSGLLATEHGGALLGGKGGSGKTTSSIAGGLGGMGFLGDDQVGLERLADGTFVGHSLYNSTRLAPDNIGRFPTLVNQTYDLPYETFGEAKHLIFLDGILPRPMPRSVPILAVVLPRLSGASTTSYTPATPAEALLRLAPSSVTMTLRSGAEGFARLSDLIRQVPAYWLDLGPDVTDVPGQVSAILGEADASSKTRQE